MYDFKDIKLDVCCGKHKKEDWIGLDLRDFDCVDIVHNVQSFPFPLKDNSCVEIQMLLSWSCIEPKYRIMLMNEFWRIAKKGCILRIRECHTNSHFMMHDPIYYTGANEITFTYFDPKYAKYNCYEPKPWKILDYFSDSKSVVDIKMEPIK